MSVNAISQLDLHNLLLKISKTSSFVEKLHFTLNWAGNDFQKIAFTGVSWFNETSFFIKADQLSTLFGVKPETISASLRHNNFIKQYNPFPNGQRYFWTKPGFSMHGFQSKNQSHDQNLSTSTNTEMSNSDQILSTVKLNSEESDKQQSSISTSQKSTDFHSQATNSISETTSTIEKEEENQKRTQLKTGNREFDDISNIIFSNSELLNEDEISDIFYEKFCPIYIEKSSVEKVFKDYFNTENCHLQIESEDSELVLNREEFWRFYQHFGPLNSILSKYDLLKKYLFQNSSCKISINDKNKFLVDDKFLIFNDFKQSAGKLFLKDENGHSYDSWDKIIESQNKLHETSSQLNSSNFIIYPILTQS